MGPEDGARAGISTSAEEPCLDPYYTLSHAAAKAPRAYSWTRAGIAEPEKWQETARIKLAELSGYGRFGGPPQMLGRRDCGTVDGFRHESLFVRARHAYDVPIRLVYQDAVGQGVGGQGMGGQGGAPRIPLICLQGGGLGMHVSWGEASDDAERAAIAAGYDFARQAAARGYLAVCVELMGAGSRRPADSAPETGAALTGIATHGMLLGHSLLGHHASDISMVVNWLTGLEVGIPVDTARTAVIGHDLGAAAALLAAALDDRLAAVAMIDPPARFRDAVKRRAVTPEMTMPGLLRWMDIDDILLLCAPRPVLACPGVAAASPADAADLIEGARLFYGLLDAAPALAAVDDAAALWPQLDAALQER
jgi:pimeloyl-ACP methyl ester carboxylesterase